MAQSAQQLIKNLNDAIKKDDHNQVYEYSKIISKQFPDDQQYLQCFIISAFKINLLEDLDVLFKNPPSKQPIKKLYAYYLYFTSDYERAISYLESLLSKNNNSLFKLLLAQCYFKINEQSSSAKIMLDLLKQSNKLEKQDLQMYLVNLFATSINKYFDQSTLQKYKNISKQNYCRQIYFNLSLLYISLQDYKAGVQCLNIFENALKKGQDDNDIQMVNILKDYIKFSTNRNKKALTMDIEEIQQKITSYQEIQNNINDVNLKNVIKNNKIFLKYQNSQHLLQNFHQIIRIIQESLEKKNKTTKNQEFILKLNKFTILLRKNRFVQAAKILKDLESQYEPELYLNQNINFFKGKYYLMKKNLKENLKQSTDIFGFINITSKLHKNLAFCLLADLKRQEESQKDLISQLKQQSSHSIIIRNYIFSLLIKNSSLFQEYHQYLAQLLQKTNDFKILDVLLKLYENKKDTVKQQTILKKILKVNPKDSTSKVKLAQIYLYQRKIQEAQELLRGIQQPEQLKDINYLQNIQKNIHISTKKDQQIAVLIPSSKKESKQVASTKQNLKKRIKKTRRPRYPKNIQKIVEGFKGDPQRWLPKWQRKGYKKKGKKGTGKTQGLATVGKQQTKNVFTTNASTSAKQVTKQVVKKRK